jgi:hypothetical protein
MTDDHIREAAFDAAVNAFYHETDNRRGGTVCAVRAAIDAYLSKMPRGWALKVGNMYRAQSNLSRRDIEFDNAIMRGLGQVVEVAIVEMPEVK